MRGHSVSVIVVSRDRPAALVRCLKALTQQTHEPFEIIVVADKQGRQAITTRPEVYRRIKVVKFDEPNISVARNLGIAQAAGEIVAFIDDDAVAEPLWLDHLTQPFTDERVDASTGYVIGRNGISFQHRLGDVGPEGDSREVPFEGTEAQIVNPSKMRAIKTQGTNMAFRRELLLKLRGFDPEFRFYLDEADLDIRLAREGGTVAIAPLAQVHHGFEESARRRRDRVPRTLFDVGASLAVFLARHSYPQNAWRAGLKEREARRRSLIEHMVAGRIEPGEVKSLLRTFDEGWSDGQNRELEPLKPISPAESPFLRYRPDVPRQEHAVVAGRIWQQAASRDKAQQLADSGHAVTLILLSPTTVYHRVRFELDGYWIQRGGLYGRSIRAGSFMKLTRFQARIRREIGRLVPVRGVTATKIDKR